MKLHFAGTRGEIDERTRRHHRHTALVVSCRRRRVMIDCGADWAGRVREINPHAIVITHAHPDHAWGLREGVDCPIFATGEAWKDMQDYPIDERRTVAPRQPLDIEGITFEAFEVEHSTRCPAVGYRVSAGRASVFYIPDVVFIHERDDALRGVDLYIGDGATLDRPLVRRRGERLIGHTPVRTQLTWCENAGVDRAVFTHCGSQIVAGDERRIGPRLRGWGRARGVEASIAYDGLELVLR
ncbi:MAG: MBL fold metallo-hydrolase [Planctomycetota bacterium]|nr:MBL fold metallo-hydrolase [Planctomycetota bacterium]